VTAPRDRLSNLWRRLTWRLRPGATNIQFWEPDTCPCAVAERKHWDRVDPSKHLYKTYDHARRRCTAHESVSYADLYNVIFADPSGENRRKNEIEKILTYCDRYGCWTRQPSGQYSRVLKPGIAFLYGWTGEGRDRLLHVGISGASLAPVYRELGEMIAATAHAGKVEVHLGTDWHESLADQPTRVFAGRRRSHHSFGRVLSPQAP
jgi:hypothetical protein